ncbi:hypothetical protein ABFK62_03135 [Acinetobacter baumannii]|uniref:hypothetical protein n=1 Tax=Acinetobacter baumannii TaxID=470 RepID=UPI000743E315|nr:hypothetical protein [Acinetobacter baumannii]MBZ0484703.1 hypothetical protein [Acinetobacter baumannii]HCT9561387.1 hypothetical protein [Acinetobacter baumannii]
MSIEIDEAKLNDCTLRALINSLQLHGHNLDQILGEYESVILGSEVSGASPQYKNASIEVLKERISEAKSNSLLGNG